MELTPFTLLEPYWTAGLITWIVLAGSTCGVLFFYPAPYGRHRKAGWGPTTSGRLGWLIQEMPALVVFPGLWICTI